MGAVLLRSYFMGPFPFNPLWPAPACMCGVNSDRLVHTLMGTTFAGITNVTKKHYFEVLWCSTNAHRERSPRLRCPTNRFASTMGDQLSMLVVLRFEIGIHDWRSADGIRMIYLKPRVTDQNL